MKLLMPIGGQSSRYGLSRPKWLLTLPSGRLMIEEAIGGLDLSKFSTIEIIAVKEYFEPYISTDQLSALISEFAKCPVNINILPNKTRSQPETVLQGLNKIQGEFPFLVKDCDNSFQCDIKPGNRIYCLDLNNIDFINARNKSYISFNDLGLVDRIIEKKVISNYFCVGGYSFCSKSKFIQAYNQIESHVDDMYLSHLIFHQIASGELFYAEEVSNYVDWGTIHEYKSYQSGFASIFCDFDGVLVFNSSKFASPPWQYEPIDSNLKYLSNFLIGSKYTKLIITTSRPKSEESNIAKFLANYKIIPHAIISELPHSQRILINDYSSTNPYPSAISVSIPRDTYNLSDYLSKFLTTTK